MGKKMLIIVGIIAVLFIALIFVVQYKNNQALEGADNPYGTKDLHQATIDQLKDPNLSQPDFAGGTIGEIGKGRRCYRLFL